MAFSPIKGSAFIEDQYKRYLSTMFMIDNPDYQSQFAEQIKQHSAFSAGPYLDVHDNYRCGSTTRELVQKGILPKTFLKYGFHHDRPLYTHQEIALEKAMHGENIVVSTGTGSGKTESFLMPILANLAVEAEAGTLGKGVRALIIYPMNALANDQVERLRTLLKNTPQVTFGCYTGQTRQTYKDAYYEYKKLNGTEPNSNELISRDQMKEYPPNLLITNYAMLEYLMVRPKDTPLFQDNTWKFVVLDEAHIYRGSTGIEVSMLLRRLKATLSGKKLQYFITSATLGDETENAAVADFATNLCDSPFSAENIIRAIRIPVPEPDSPIQVPIAFYKQIKDLIDEDYEIDWINQKVFREYPNYNLHPEKPLFDLIRRDERYWKIRNLLKDPVSIKVLQDETGLSEDEIESFVAVASFCEADGIRLLDARYHSFLRATDSVFVTLAPSNKLFLTRNKQYLESTDGQNYKVFEVATCSSCHRIYLVGKLNDQTHILEQNAGFGPKDIFYLGSDSSATDDDTEAEEGKNEPGTICAICGRFTRDRVRGEDKCEHSKQYQIPVVRAKTKAPDHRLKKCIHCEAVNNYGILRYFFTGQEAVTSVIATSLFEVLPSQTQVTVKNQKQEDEFGFGFVQEETEPTKKQTEQARQFLCFSDSRQASAYFATYLDTSYRKLLYKRCIYEELQKMNGNVPLRDFCEDLSVLFEKKKILAGTGYRKEKESWKAILSEMADGNGDTSLSGMGMMSIGLRPGSLGPNAMLHMTGAEVTDMFNILLRSLITDLAVTVPVAMNEEDREFYAYGSVPPRYEMIVGKAKENIKSFIPRNTSRKNKRFDYLIRMLNQKVPGMFDPDKIRNLMGKLWEILCGTKILVYQEDGFQLDFEKLYVNTPRQWYRCTKCRRLTPYNIADVCETYQCDGRLTPADPDSELKANHYYRLYHDLDMQPLRVKEHTAQLNRDQAYAYQQEFKDKKIDVLSCSTTFEMGVDVGSLETVFMRNMPPLPSNYAQRAGRAGRSRHSAAFALTFCNRASHDFSYFSRPEDMIRGKIHAPHFNILNEKIAIRHLYASALSFFWKEYPETFSTADKMATSHEEENGYKKLIRYLNDQPAALKKYLHDFLPAELYDRFDCEHFGWIDGLINETDLEEGVLTKAIEDYSYEVNLLEKAREEAFEAHRSTGSLEQRLRTYKREDILSFLSRRNVMPQYGFPVDTVSMTIATSKYDQNYGVELQRDLAVAISEYAPGAQIVANGELFTGRYIKKIPQIGWKMYDYLYCEQCGTLNIALHTGNTDDSEMVCCRVCEAPLDKKDIRTFIVPSFGFEIDPDDIRKPGLIRPEKTYRTDAYYVGYRNDAQIVENRIGKTVFQYIFSEKDEMAVLNKTDFHVCEYCGYAEQNESFIRTIEKEHRSSNGRICKNKWLKKYSLGYRFETDVFQLIFPDYPLIAAEENIAQSVLYALIRGFVHVLDLEDNDISGCLRVIGTGMGRTIGFVFYDSTPGGAGHVRRLQDKDKLQEAIIYAYELMKNCTCGGQNGHTSCYSCLRSYQNQKLHDVLDRTEAMNYLQKLIQTV